MLSAHKWSVDGLVQDCSISIVNALKILQSCTKPSIYDDNSGNSSVLSSQVSQVDGVKVMPADALAPSIIRSSPEVPSSL